MGNIGGGGEAGLKFQEVIIQKGDSGFVIQNPHVFHLSFGPATMDQPSCVRHLLGGQAFGAGVLAVPLDRSCLLYTSPSPRD